MEAKDAELLALKRELRCQMNRAAAEGTLDGPDILGVLMCVAGEMVAEVQDSTKRREFVDTVVSYFPGFVEMARGVPRGVTVQ